MKKSCKEGERVHHILDSKLERFNKITIEIGYGCEQNRAIRLRDRSNEPMSIKKVGKSHYGWRN
jgi:hypothetical protein